MERMAQRGNIEMSQAFYMEVWNGYERSRELEEENKKLNIKVASLEGEIKGLNSVIDKLKEENQTLELWLDNKEKVNKKLREDIEMLSGNIILG